MNEGHDSPRAAVTKDRAENPTASLFWGATSPKARCRQGQALQDALGEGLSLSSCSGGSHHPWHLGHGHVATSL